MKINDKITQSYKWAVESGMKEHLIFNHLVLCHGRAKVVKWLAVVNK